MRYSKIPQQKQDAINEHKEISLNKRTAGFLSFACGVGAAASLTIASVIGYQKGMNGSDINEVIRACFVSGAFCGLSEILGYKSAKNYIKFKDSDFDLMLSNIRLEKLGIKEKY